MTPASKSLEVALPVLNPALEQGTQVLGRTPALNAQLQQTMQALQTLSAAPGTNVALNALVDTLSTLNPMVRYLGRSRTVCNDWGRRQRFGAGQSCRRRPARSRPARPARRVRRRRAGWRRRPGAQPGQIPHLLAATYPDK